MPKRLTAIFAASMLSFGFAINPAAAASYVSNNAAMAHSKMNMGNMNHDQMMKNNVANLDRGKTGMLPTEPGQGAFATIAEIVAMLTNDPSTDWSKVNIDALREHLIDMDELTLRATAKTTVSENKVVFTVTGTGRTKKAIQNMVPAHAGVLARTTAWDAKGEVSEDGAILTITSNKPTVLNVVKALGFFGVMATGAHHQAHHLAMAKGDKMVHAHN